ncbi:MAG TPA: hypothetical protein VHF06_09040, partial [Pseudonocardiaceae bacterium]|nr:hypothetical protein [Pseudonocardiaceae bacterium]
LQEVADGVELLERFDVALPLHDPDGRDRTMSCGAAVTNVVTAFRAQGHAVRLTLFPHRGRPEVVAHVAAVGAERPSSTDLAWWAAIDRRHSYRAPFDLLGVSWRDRDALVSAISSAGVTAHVLRRAETIGLADLLDYASLAYRDDIAYDRELRTWLPGFPGRIRARSTSPWNGLARSDTAIPDRFVLADRLRRECVVFVLTDGDRRRDHLVAGMAMQRAWLTAVSRGLVASVLTQPWHLPEVRDSLITLLGCGTPQLMLRIGRPTGNTVVTLDGGRTPHRPIG